MEQSKFKERVTAHLRIIRSQLESYYPDNSNFTFRSIDGLYEDWPQYWAFILRELEELKKYRSFHQAFYSSISSGELSEEVKKVIPTLGVILNSKGLSEDIVKKVTLFVELKADKNLP